MQTHRIVSLRNILGILDRFLVGGRWPVTLWIFIFLVAGAAIVESWTTIPLIEYLSLQGPWTSEPWRLWTYPLVGGLEAALGVILLGLVAGDAAALLGPRRFGTYLLLITFSGGFLSISCLPEVPVRGPFAPAIGMAIAFAQLSSNRRVYGFLPTSVVATCLTVTFVALLGFQESGQLSAILLQGIGAATAGIGYFWIRPHLLRRRALRSLLQAAFDIQTQELEQRRLDQLLEKISKAGTESLSLGDRRFLRRTSRRMKNQQPSVHTRQSD
jgi:hypothetical protein